jgi:hypothetical protein
MSELIQPMLVMETNIGAVAVALQLDLTREEAETEAAYILHTAPDDVVVYRATVLMLAQDTAPDAIDAWAAGLPVHSVDCDCEEVDAVNEADAIANLEMYLASFVTGPGCGHEGHEGRDCGV